MTLTLWPDLERIVEELLAAGQFTTPEEVVRVGLLLLHMRSEELKALISESVAQAATGILHPWM
jgi:hypothetical protein